MTIKGGAGDQFAAMIPAGTMLHHATMFPDEIRSEGVRPSRQGESGPGVYTTPEANETYAHGRTPLTFETTSDLRLLDRGSPGGEEHYRELHGGNYRNPERIQENIAAAGYHGVRYPTSLRGKDATEIVVHDPAHLRLRS